MDKNGIIHLFDLSRHGISQLMSDTQYHVSAAWISFDYGDENVRIENVSFVGFSRDGTKVYFDDSKGYEVDMLNGSFLISSEPSETLHPLVIAFGRVKGIIEAFGERV